MSSNDGLLGRVLRLESVAAIHALKSRYAALADAKYTRDFQRVSDQRMEEVAWQQALCFTDDAVWFGGEFGGDRRGREQLHEWFQHSPWRFATHLYAGPELEVSDDHAQGRWRLWQLALPEDRDGTVLLTGTTRETYRRTADGAWLIASMAFEDVQMMQATHSTHPLVHRLSDLPGFNAR